MKLAFAGGGTGGHLAPAIAILEELRSRGDDSPALFLTAGRSAPGLVGAFPGSRTVSLPAASLSLRRVWSIPEGGIRNYRGYRLSLRALERAEPDLVLGLGGYVSVPPVLAARRLKVPVVLHEQNAVMGRANRFLSRFATMVIGSFPLVGRGGRRMVLNDIGFPLRLAARNDAPEGTITGWGLSRRRFTILVLGGSRGARSVNRLLEESIGALGKEEGLQFIHCAGPLDLDRMTGAYREGGLPAAVFEGLSTIGWGYSLADLVVGRAGGATLSEIAYWGLPSILIPYPWATDDHQLANARHFQRSGAALVYEQAEVSASLLVEVIIRLKRDREERERMSAAARRLHKPGGAGKMVDLFGEMLKDERTG